MPDFVLGVDLDGVCADHTAGFRRVVAAELGMDEDALGPQLSWDFAEWGLDRAAFERLHRAAVLEHRMFRTMPAVPGAADALWRLSDAGAWIRVITHRLHTNWGHAVAVADTVAWLDAHAVPYRDLCFLGDKPQVEADAYLDDAPHNVAALRATGAPVLVFAQPYNESLDGPRAAGWAEVEEWVLARMAEAGLAVQAPMALGDVSDRLRGRVPPGADGAAGSDPGSAESSSG
jgi:5'(3')-deoxyribonucleotidase